MSTVLVFGQKTVWIKSFRFGKLLGITVQIECVHMNLSANGQLNLAAGNSKRFDQFTAQKRNGRIQPKRFLDETIKVLHIIVVGNGQR